jgi:CheY-like chemotaxis protein
MPVMDGLTLARLIRERDVNLPVVFMSAGGRARLAAETLQVAGYLEKPFTLDHLYHLVAMHAAARSPSPG